MSTVINILVTQLNYAVLHRESPAALMQSALMLRMTHRLADLPVQSACADKTIITTVTRLNFKQTLKLN